MEIGSGGSFTFFGVMLKLPPASGWPSGEASSRTFFLVSVSRPFRLCVIRPSRHISLHVTIYNWMFHRSCFTRNVSSSRENFLRANLHLWNETFSFLIAPTCVLKTSLKGVKKKRKIFSPIKLLKLFLYFIERKNLPQRVQGKFTSFNLFFFSKIISITSVKSLL